MVTLVLEEPTAYICMVSCTLKMEVAGSSTLITAYHSTWLHKPEDYTVLKFLFFAGLSVWPAVKLTYYIEYCLLLCYSPVDFFVQTSVLSTKICILLVSVKCGI